MKDVCEWLAIRLLAALFIFIGAWLIGPPITFTQAFGIYLIVSAATL